MIRKTIKFRNFDGEVKTTDAYFNLTEVEMLRLDAEFPGGLEVYVNSLDEHTSASDILRLFERLVATSYGVKSSDGNSFVKTDEVTNEFLQSAAYPALVVYLLQNPTEAAAFFNGMITETSSVE